MLGQTVEVQEHGAALAHQADPAGDQRRRHQQRVGGDPPPVVDEAEAVGALERDPVPPALVGQRPFPLGALRAHLLVVRRQQHRAADPGGGQVLDHGRHGGGAGHHVGAVDRLADRRHRRVAGQPELRLVAGIDQVDPALEAELAEVGDQRGAPGRVLGRTDQGQGTGVEDHLDALAPPAQRRLPHH